MLTEPTKQIQEPQRRALVLEALVAGLPVTENSTVPGVRYEVAAELRADLDSYLVLRRAAWVGQAKAIGTDPVLAGRYQRLIDTYDRRIEEVRGKIESLAYQRSVAVYPAVTDKTEGDRILRRLLDRNTTRIKAGFKPWVPSSLCALDNPKAYADYSEQEADFWGDLNGLSYWLPGQGPKVLELISSYKLPSDSLDCFNHHLVELEISNRLAGRPISYEIPESMYARR